MGKKINDDILDELLKGCERPEDLLGEGGLMKDLKKALIERMLGAELTEHLGYEHGAEAPPVKSNRRNGVSRKSVKSEDGAFEIEVPRDRDGGFEPRLIGKGQTRIDGLDDKIIAMCARGMSVRDIRGHLEELYGLEVSPDLISRVTDAVLDEVKEWRSRALDAVYPVVIFDALRVTIRDKDSRIVKNKAVYLALGITGDGQREVLGLWIADNEGEECQELCVSGRLDARRLGLGVALAGRRHQRGVDDLARHRQISRLGDRPVQPRKQRIQCVCCNECLAEVPERIRVRHGVAGAELAEPHPAQPVGDQVFRLRQRRPGHRLQHQHASRRRRPKSGRLQHRIEGWPSALRAVPEPQRSLQRATKDLEINRRGELLERVALRRQLPQPLLHVPEPRLPARHAPSSDHRVGQAESCRCRQSQPSFRKCQGYG
jgi:hypothetical protein